CDVRCGGHIMGDAFELRTAPKLQIKVIGTGPLEKIDVLRDSDVVATLEPEGIEFAGEWTDPDPPAGEHYYYVRVLQKDQELAWTSPMWVTYRK
ncbi:MAG TPA: hypothetical protein VIL46_18920, partial [Gemmataceae bacterium]